MFPGGLLKAGKLRVLAGREVFEELLFPPRKALCSPSYSSLLKALAAGGGESRRRLSLRSPFPHLAFCVFFFPSPFIAGFSPSRRRGGLFAGREAAGGTGVGGGQALLAYLPLLSPGGARSCGGGGGLTAVSPPPRQGLPAAAAGRSFRLATERGC